jgi:hypothetical protein
MRSDKLPVPKDIGEIVVLLNWMLLRSPKFTDKTGHFPFMGLDVVFRQLNDGLGCNRPTLGDERYQKLMQMSDQMRALFEADPEAKTGDTLKGCKIIHEMEAILRQARRKS